MRVYETHARIAMEKVWFAYDTYFIGIDACGFLYSLSIVPAV